MPMPNALDDANMSADSFIAGAEVASTAWCDVVPGRGERAGNGGSWRARPRNGLLSKGGFMMAPSAGPPPPPIVTTNTGSYQRIGEFGTAE